MYYIVGLSNPGKEYEHTRHNVGFAVLEHFAERNSFSSWHDKSAYSGTVAEGSVGGEELVLLKPHTFMNDSGSAVKKLVKKGEEEKLIVVYDDVDLPFGEIKLSFSRGNGGHNGVRSIIDTLGTPDFVRVRLGVAQKSLFTGSLKRPKGEALAQFVLGTFSRGETKQLPDVLTRASEAIETIVKEGRERAANKFN
jgi:PTH1 family peptidyl-tRNA hydrolase